MFFRKTFLIALFLSALLLSITSCASRHHPAVGDGVYHVVRPGQTLYRIALTYRVPLDRVARVNGIANPHRIRSGQRLFIPGARSVLEVPVIRPNAARLSLLPVAGSITSYFGSVRRGHRHTGIDIAAPRGSPVRAVLAGRVVFSGRLGDYGNTIKVQHSDGLLSLYAHNDSNLVRRGQPVQRGQRIATVGRSGNASGYHLHFEIRRHGTPIDPLSLLSPAAH